jgi:Cu+-exporting ATPase
MVTCIDIPLPPAPSNATNNILLPLSTANYATTEGRCQPAVAPGIAGHNYVTAVLLVDGMTCASCVAAVEGGVRPLSGVSAIKVNLLTKQATVTFDPVQITAAAVAAAITDMGFEASLPPPEAIVINIDGMTCASCVGKVEKTLRKRPGVRNVSVNLMAANARIELDPGAATGVRDLIETVENLGFV